MTLNMVLCSSSSHSCEHEMQRVCLHSGVCRDAWAKATNPEALLAVGHRIKLVHQDDFKVISLHIGATLIVSFHQKEIAVHSARVQADDPFRSRQFKIESAISIAN